MAVVPPVVWLPSRERLMATLLFTKAQLLMLGLDAALSMAVALLRKTQFTIKGFAASRFLIAQPAFSSTKPSSRAVSIGFATPNGMPQLSKITPSDGPCRTVGWVIQSR